MMRAIIPLLLLFASMISGKYLLVETDSNEKVNYIVIALLFMLKCFSFPHLNQMITMIMMGMMMMLVIMIMSLQQN